MGATGCRHTVLDNFCHVLKRFSITRRCHATRRVRRTDRERTSTQFAGRKSGQRFDYDAFVERVADRAGVEEADAAYYAQTIISLVDDAVPDGEMDDVEEQLPEEYTDLFGLIDQDIAS